MSRVVKGADERRDELLDTALQLFLEHGYERTSVELITSTVGVAKGTFYHYFETKQELLEQLVARFTDGLFEEVEEGLAAVDGGAVDRLKAFFAMGSKVKLGHRDETLMLTRPLFMAENQELLHRLLDGWFERTRPLIQEILEQGVAEGAFDVPDPVAMAEVWLALWFDCGVRVSRRFFSAGKDPEFVDEVIAAYEALVLAEERILGLKAGALEMNVGPTVRAILNGL